MALKDTDIVLSVGLDVKDAEKSAGELQKEVEAIFNSRSGQQSSSLTSLELQMKQTLQQSQVLRESLSELSGVKVVSDDYAKLSDEIEALEQKAAKLKQRMRDFEELGGDLGSKTYASMALQFERLEDEGGRLAEKQAELREKNLQFVQFEETEAYKRQQEQLDKINDKLKQQLIHHEEIVRKEQEQVEKSQQKANNEALREGHQEVTELSRDMGVLSSTIRGITRLIPGVSSTGVMGISMLTRGIVRLTNLTKKQLLGALNAVKTTIGKIIAMIAAHPVILAIAAAIAALSAAVIYLKKTWEQAKEAIEATIEVAKAGLKKIANLSKDAAGWLLKSFVKIGTFVPKMFTAVIKATVTQLKSLKGTISENLKLMAEWNDGNNKVNESLSNLTSSTNYLKAAISSVAVPVLTALEPILSRVADRASELATNIGMLLAKFLGDTTFLKATKQQKDYAKSLKDTNKALSSLDNLNVLGSSDTNQSVDFELVNLEQTQLSDWLDNLENLGNRMGTILTDMLNSVPWEMVQENLNKLTSGLADFINGFNDTNFGETVGATIGNGLNTITSSITSFLDELDGKKLGEQLGDILETMVTTINFNDLGTMFSDSVNELMDIIIGFSDHFKGEDLATALTDFLQNALGGIDWDKVQTAIDGMIDDLVGFLNGVMTEENLQTVATTLSNVLTSLFNGLWKFVKQVDWAEWGYRIGGAIETMVRTTDWKMGGMAVGRLAKGLLDSLLAAIKQVKWTGPGSVAQSLIDFIAGIPWKDIATKAKQISEDLRTGLQEVWKELKTSGALDDLIEIIVEFLEEKKNWEKAIKKAEREVTGAVVQKKIVNDVAPIVLNPIVAGGLNSTSAGTTLKTLSLLTEWLKKKTGYATGQVIPPSMSEHLALLGDNKHETEVVSPLSTMQQALFNALEMAGAVGGNQEIVINLDGREFLRAMVKQNNEYKKQHGGVSALA